MLQLCCVELGCRQCTVADAALIQTLLPCLFRSIATTIRHLGRASIAFRFLADVFVPSPHIQTVGVECRACQCFPADDTLHFGVVVSGPASCDAMCFAQYACLCASTRLYFTLLYFTLGATREQGACQGCCCESYSMLECFTICCTTLV